MNLLTIGSMFAPGRGGGAKPDIQHGTYSFFFSDGDNDC